MLLGAFVPWWRKKKEGSRIEITKENSVLIAKMERNRKSQLVSEKEKTDFLKELEQIVQNELGT